MALVRLPVDREGLHADLPVRRACRSSSPRATTSSRPPTRSTLADLADEQLVAAARVRDGVPEAAQLDWPADDRAGGDRDRRRRHRHRASCRCRWRGCYHRKDVVRRPVTDLAPTTVALAWLVERDDDRAQRFVGVSSGVAATRPTRRAADDDGQMTEWLVVSPPLPRHPLTSLAGARPTAAFRRGVRRRGPARARAGRPAGSTSSASTPTTTRRCCRSRSPTPPTPRSRRAPTGGRIRSGQARPSGTRHTRPG